MTRVLSGVVLAAVFFAIVWFGSSPVLLAVAIVVCTLAFHEYAELMTRLAAAPAKKVTLVATLATLATVPYAYAPVASVIGIGMVVIAISQMAVAERNLARLKPAPTPLKPAPTPLKPGPTILKPPPTTATTDMAGLKPGPATGATVVGPGFSPAIMSTAAGALAILYLGLPLGALVAVHALGGRGAVLLLVATVALSDTAQYYAGRSFGRRPLAPRLSPKKTIEGAIGGFVAAPVFLFFAGPYLLPGANPLVIAPLGVALVVAGIAGDLFESMLKRAADVKDSSTLIPGHGGVLDRIDALLFATPIFYMYLRWLVIA